MSTRTFLVGTKILTAIIALLLYSLTILIYFYNHTNDSSLLDQHKQEAFATISYDDDSSNRASMMVAANHVFYAPLIVNAGRGTTGTRLFHEATCRLGIVSLHWHLGCFPKNETLMDSSHDYLALVGHQLFIVESYLKDPSRKTSAYEYKHKILRHLEAIIKWGKENKVALALHDTPFPFLMPSILQLVKKYYGERAKPIILLSERDPDEWTVRRIEVHGSYTFLCNFNQTNLIEAASLEGGAFDLIGCINKALSQEQASLQPVRLNEVLCHLGKLTQPHEVQYISSTFRGYQDAVRDHAVFNFNMFERGIKTDVEDLACWIKNAIGYNIINGSHPLMREGLDFMGFDSIRSSMTAVHFPPNPPLHHCHLSSNYQNRIHDIPKLHSKLLYHENFSKSS